MTWLLKDGDVWLLALLVGAGALPVIADVAHHRPFGAEATLGGLVALASAAGLVRRLTTHLRAEALRRRMLRP